MSLLVLLLLVFTMLMSGCAEKPSITTMTTQKPTVVPMIQTQTIQMQTTPTTETVIPAEMKRTRGNIVIDGKLDDVSALDIKPVLVESKLDISESANPKEVYIFTDGEWSYVAIEFNGKFDESRRYVLNIVDKKGGKAFNIKWFPGTGFVTDYFVKSGGKYRYVKSYETHGIYRNNTIEIASKCFKIAKDFNFVSLIVSYPNSDRFEYCKVIFKDVKLDEVIPFVKLNISFGEIRRQELNNITPKAWEIHENAWKYVVKKAKTDNYFKYGIYASRTLAVRHPEIYLQADKLFIKKITTNKGFKKSYEIKDVHSKYLFGREKMVGEPFSFDLVDFSKYRIISSKDIYPTEYPVFDYIDRRLSPVSVTLKTYNDEITELEKIVQLYLKDNSLDKYIINCDNDKAYLWKDGKLIDANLKVVEKLEGNPILIFNEKYVWYPLMERNDSSKDYTLKMLVEKYSTDVKMPKLSDFEAEIVKELKIVTELKDDKQKKLAKLSSIRAGIRYFGEDWRSVFPEIRNYGTFYCIMKEIIKDGNYLSPITAYLSAIVSTKPNIDGLRCMCKEYLRYASTNGKFAHGHLWKCAMVEYLIEDAYRAKTGHCVDQSANLMAVLNLAGVECNRISAVSVLNIVHDWLYIPKYDIILSNGKIDTFNKVIWTTRDGKKLNIIRFISYRDNWSLILPYNYYTGTLSPEETINILQYLRSVHDEDIYGGIKIGGEWQTISFNKLIRTIESKKYSWKALTLN